VEQDDRGKVFGISGVVEVEEAAGGGIVARIGMVRDVLFDLVRTLCAGGLREHSRGNEQYGETFHAGKDNLLSGNWKTMAGVSR
jgi:hypothetical protein